MINDFPYNYNPKKHPEEIKQSLEQILGHASVYPYKPMFSDDDLEKFRKKYWEALFKDLKEATSPTSGFTEFEIEEDLLKKICGEEDGYEDTCYPDDEDSLVGGVLSIDEGDSTNGIMLVDKTHLNKKSAKLDGADDLCDIKPDYYDPDSIYEVFKVLRAWGLDKDFFLGNAIKYIKRCDLKGNDGGIEDLRKAITYLKDELNHRITQSDEYE